MADKKSLYKKLLELFCPILLRQNWELLAYAIAIPVAAAALQWLVWPYLPPATWILFYPAIFLSAWIGGFCGGLVATLIAAALGIYFFIEPQLSFEIHDPRNYNSILIFLGMGFIMSLFHERHQLAQDKINRLSIKLAEVSQTRLQMALEAANAGMWEWNLDDNTNEWSESLWDLYGLETNSRDPSYEAWLDIIHPDDKAEAAAVVNKAAQTGGEILVEWRLKDRSRWLMAKGKPELDSSGKPVLYRGIVIDVTERKKMETTLQEKGQRLDFALSTLNVGAWELDLDTHQVHRTLLHDQIFGYPELLDNWSFEIALEHILPEDRDIVNQTLQQAIANQTNWTVECRIRRVDGEIRWIHGKGQQKHDSFGNPLPKFAGIIQDITETKQMANELQRWADAFRYCAHGIAIGDPNNNCISFCNPSFSEMLGYDHPGEVIGIPILQIYTPEMHERVKGYIQEADRQGKTQYESLYRHKNGTTFEVQIDLVSVKNPENQILYRVATVQDISKRKGLELIVREKGRLLADSQAIAHVGSWKMDVNTGLIVWSDEHFRLFGLSPDTDSVPTYEQFLLLLHPDDRPAMEQWIDDCRTGKRPECLEFRIQTKDGAIRWVYGCGQLEKDAEGRPLRMIGTSQDITERKRIEDERRHIEARYRALVDQAAPDAFYVHDHEGNFIEVNQKACEWDGYSREELLKMNVLDVENDFDLPKVQAVWSSIQPGVAKTLYGHHRRRDGSKFPVEVRFGLLEEKGQRYYIALVRDISERHQAQAQLLLQSKALEAAANAIMIADPKGVIEWVNPAFTKLTGYTKEDAIGSDTDRLFKCNVRHPDVHEEVWTTISKGQIWHGEIVYQRKDGSFYNEEQTITPVFNEQGAIQHYIAIKQDITLRKQNEAELERYQDHLEQLVQNRTLELNEAREEAVRLSQVKSAFLANMSHEIRSPMNAMMGYFYLLEQRPLEEEARGLIRKVRYAGQSLLAIINDILDFSKIESGRLEIENIPFRLSDILDQIAALMSTSAGEKNLELIINPSPSYADHLIGDGLRLQQVLVNLTSNAIKFTRHGEVELSITVVGEHEENFITLHFAVRDTGIGISKDKQAEIFTAFTQADSTIGRRFGGTGLGLAISQQLVSLMGGSLKVESRLGKGSSFWFELTLERDRKDGHNLYKFTHIDLLVADDCETARTALANTSNAFGWTTVAVASGQAALNQTLQRAETGKPYDVVLLDWKMPGLDGLATAQIIKTTARPEDDKQAMPPIVIMVSAFSREELLNQPGIEYVDSILGKPVTPSALYNVIIEAMNKRDPIQKIRLDPKDGQQKHDLMDIRILVVDDSDINREIAERILKMHGATVVSAESGQQAIDWLTAHPDGTDVVLMDVQMPGMDGYETTRILRQYYHWSDLPIIALTAGAFTVEQEAARNSGMNDFISKPFNVEQLIKTIQHYANGKPEPTPKKQAVDNQNTQFDDFGPNHGVPDINIIDVNDGIARFGDKAAYYLYLGKFSDSYSQAGDEIAQQIQSGDLNAASSLVHKLKGVAGNLSLKAVFTLVKALEEKLLPGCTAADGTTALQQALEEACQEIDRLKANAPNADTGLAAEEVAENIIDELIGLLRQLVQTLEQNNPSAAEPFLRELKSKLPHTTFHNIKDLIDYFDFRGAEKSINELILKLNNRIR